jgi:small subunit ribosomal protein S9
MQTTTDYTATGRRKTSVARVRLADGTGKFTVNSRPLDEYLMSPNLRMHAMEPLTVGAGAAKYDVTVSVKGGGPNGQAGAIRLGIARALLKASPEVKAALREKGLLTRDPRARERKKYGQPGARRRFQFSKR